MQYLYASCPDLLMLTGFQGLIEGGVPMGLADFAGGHQRRIPGFGGLVYDSLLWS